MREIGIPQIILRHLVRVADVLLCMLAARRMRVLVVGLGQCPSLLLLPVAVDIADDAAWPHLPVACRILAELVLLNLDLDQRVAMILVEVRRA